MSKKKKFVGFLGKIIQVPEDAKVEQEVKRVEGGYDVTASISFNLYAKPIHPRTQQQFIEAAKEIIAKEHNFDTWEQFQKDCQHESKIFRLRTAWIGVADILSKQCAELEAKLFEPTAPNKFKTEGDE